MLEAYKKMLINYANFKDRTTRKDFWLAFLMDLIISFVLGFIAGLSGITLLDYLSNLYAIAVLIPSIAMVVRRLHDVDQSGWYYLILLIPVIGLIILIIMLCTDSIECSRGVQL